MPGISAVAKDYFQAHPEFERCRRDRRHFWPTQGTLTKLKGGLWEETLICDECTSQVQLTFNAAGQTIERRMHYAEGYVLRGERIEIEDLNLLKIAEFRERLRVRKARVEQINQHMKVA